MTLPNKIEIEPAVGQQIPATWVIKNRWIEIPRTVSIHIEPVDDGKFEFTPGQFCMVYIPGIGEIPISISSSGPGGQGIILTVRSVGKVSDAICTAAVGTWVGIRGPLGTGWPIDQILDNDLVAVGGGLGGAPLRPVLKTALAATSRTAKNVYIYGSRSPDSLLFLEEIDRWNEYANTEVLVTVDQPDSGWSRHVGLVTGLLPQVQFDPDIAIACVCGPEVMMRFTALELIAIGLSPENIYLSLERNIHCGIGLCGHCQLGGNFICTDGPVFKYSDIAHELTVADR